MDQPFWSDEFDMDFPKIFPEARGMLGDLDAVDLWTAGRTDENGRLNHPALWNGDHAMLAFFGFRHSAKPESYVHDTQVKCTAWEMFRDAWSHHYLISVERQPVWDTGLLWPQFEVLMWDLRGWRDDKERAALARRTVLKSYSRAVRRFRQIVDNWQTAHPNAD